MFTPRKRNAAVAALATVSLTAALGIFTTGASAGVQPGVAISGLSVVKGATTATTNLMITGTGFTKLHDAGVMFGTTPAVKVIVLSDTQIATVAPTNAKPGKVDVTLTDTEPAEEPAVEEPTQPGTEEPTEPGTEPTEPGTEPTEPGTEPTEPGTEEPPAVQPPAPVVTAYPALTGTSEGKDDFTYVAPFDAVVTPGTLLNSVGGGRLTVTSPADMGSTATEFATHKVTATVGGVVTPVAWVNKNTVTVTVPAGLASKTAPKVVLHREGVPGAAATGAKYAAVITATDKVGGPLKGTDTVTITGKGLTGATAWKFGTEAGVDCANVAGAVDTKVTCKVPAATGYNAVAASSTAKPGPVSITFTPADGAPYGVTPKAVWTYSDLV